MQVRRNGWRRSLSGGLFSVGLWFGAAFAQTTTEPVIQQGALSVRFDAQHGSLRDLVDGANSHDFVEEPADGLWMLPLDDGQVVVPGQASRFASNAVEKGVELVWEGFGRQDAPELKVTVHAKADGNDAACRWTIRVDGLNALPLHSVHFPRLTGLAKQENETLAVPVWMGERTRRARELLNDGTPKRWEWEYPGLLSLQCMTLYREQGPGIEVSANDTSAQRKSFVVFGDGQGGLGMEIVHVPSAQREDLNRYEPSCEVLTTLYTGDWFTAAERYRGWAKDQAWVRDNRRRRGETPQWLLDTGLWVWNRGRSPGVLEPAAALQDAAGVPVSVFWHWWHGCAYDTGFPEYLPPREGEDAFRAAMSEAQGKGLHALVYMNQRLWGMTTQSWVDEGAERYAVKGPKGDIAPEVYNTFNKAPCASMCMGTDFWRNKYAGLAEAAVRGLGVDGIYMDQACSSLACYDSTHGHPLGGGSYWMEGFQKLESDIRRRCSDVKPVALAGEGCGEAWLPHLDVMLSLQVSMERYAAPGQWEPIPYFHAVYHDSGLFYGNYSSLTRPPYDDLWPREFAPERPLELLDRKYSTQFRLEQARAFAWGQQPTVANFMPSHLTERREEMEYAIGLAKLRAKVVEYLRDGVMLRPPALEVPQVEIPMSRLSIYAGQQDAVREFAKTVPLVISGAWQAPDGRVAMALASISDQNVPVSLSLERGEYPIPESGVIRRIAQREESAVGEYNGGLAAIDIALTPFEACVIEIAARQ